MGRGRAKIQWFRMGGAQRRDNTPSPGRIPVDNTAPHARGPVPQAKPHLHFQPCHAHPQDISRIANLARLELSSHESERMLTSSTVFLTSCSQMRAVDTTGVEPLAHPGCGDQDVALRLRDDVVSEPNQREANQRSAPAVERGLFLVPKVIE
jgi:aspartyl-tRNA(Asn)/glutamyl-tRNA(Gln) amidotransferase subunit C